MIVQEIEYLSGSQDLSNLAKVKQIPAFESIEAIIQAMTPATKDRGRLLECALRSWRIWSSSASSSSMTRQEGWPCWVRMEWHGRLRLRPRNPHPRFVKSRVRGHVQDPKGCEARPQLYLQRHPQLDAGSCPCDEEDDVPPVAKGGDLDWQTFMEAMEIPNLDQVKERLTKENAGKGQYGRPGAGCSGTGQDGTGRDAQCSAGRATPHGPNWPSPGGKG